LEFHVALVTPGGAPGVSHEPVVTVGLISAPANNVSGVIKGSTAGSVGKDTGGVALENTLVSLDTDGEGSDFEGLLHGSGGVSSDVQPAVSSDTSVGHGGVVHAGTVLGGVGVGSFGHGEVVLVVVERVRTVSTAATVTQVNAINELLLSELLEDT